MKILGVVAVISTSIIEIHSRKLLDEVQLSEPVAGFVSYLSFASVSLLVGGAVLRTMYWANERRRKSREVSRRR